MTSAINHALEAAIRRAYELGRVDQSIGWAADELRRMVEADPSVTPERVLRLYGLPESVWITPRHILRRYNGSIVPGWDEALWALADIWCEVNRALQGRPERQLPASPYSVLHYAIPAREAAATSR